MLQANSKLMDMLIEYAAAHQHPFNVAVHLIGIPTIVLGVFVAFSWAKLPVFGVAVNGAFIATFILFAFYLTLDGMFSLAFLLYALPIAYFATEIGAAPMSESGTVAAAAFVGGYVAQFVGHAVEKTAPVILKHPLQANLAAPFFTVVEVFKLAGLRDDVFNEVQRRIAALQPEQTA